MQDLARADQVVEASTPWSVLVDRTTGTPISDLDAGFGPGPGASPAMRARFAALAE